MNVIYNFVFILFFFQGMSSLGHLLTNEHRSSTFIHPYHQQMILKNNVQYIFRSRFSGLIFLFLENGITSKALSIERSIVFETMLYPESIN